jgi:hypothetical protein
MKNCQSNRDGVQLAGSVISRLCCAFARWSVCCWFLDGNSKRRGTSGNALGACRVSFAVLRAASRALFTRVPLDSGRSAAGSASRKTCCGGARGMPLIMPRKHVGRRFPFSAWRAYHHMGARRTSAGAF